MLSKPLTDKQIEAAFDRFIKSEHEAIPSDSGFDSQTEAALMQVVADRRSPISIANARRVLAMQLNGTHAKDQRKVIEDLLKETEPRRKK